MARTEDDLSTLLSKLRGPLNLERDRGFDDGAVSGGFGPYVQRWADQVFNLIDQPTLHTRLTGLALSFAAYARNSPQQRRLLCTAAAELLDEMEEHLAPAPATQQVARKPKRKRSKRARTTPPQVSWRAPLTSLKGVGPARAEALAAAGLATVADLLTYYPYRYKDRPRLHHLAELDDGREACLLVRITGKGSNFYRGRLRMTQLPAVALDPECPEGAPDTDQDATPITLRWFNQPYRVEQFPVGTELVVVGPIRLKSKQPAVAVQECERATTDGDGSPGLGIGQLVPVYGRIEGVGPTVLRRLIRRALDECRELPEGLVPPELAARHNLIPLREALWQTHFPESADARQAARKRLVYQELFLLQLELARRQQAVKTPAAGAPLPVDETTRRDYLAALPFHPTAAQQRVLDEITADLAAAQPAHRLVHGDVGSGKTVVAGWALYCAVRAGKQAAMMAPTELLAHQHYRTLSGLLAPLGIEPMLLTGSMAGQAKDDVRRHLASGQPALVVGTHALFQPGVEFSDLAVAVVDEQHRFGLQQRAALAAKGLRPNVIVMSATPIPRTLALTLYGDFDISVIDELPPGRQPVQTSLLPDRKRAAAFELVAEQIARGHQAYVVCPLVGEGKKSDAEAATQLYESLRTEMAALTGDRDIAVGLVHGQMPSQQREDIMQRFRAGRIHVLVSTTVIEVGVDVANATAMVVLNAERFGLAQLHQLRGRVARSSTQARCVLLTASKAPEVVDRLRVLVETGDGFRIAEEDLLRRGPGEMVGLAQHGLPDVHMAALLADTPTLVAAREDARRLLQDDPLLEADDHRPLRQALQHSRAVPHAEWTI